MSHSNQPEYFTITTVCPYDGSTSMIGIFEDMDAVSYRLKQMYTSCGDEIRIECSHLQTAEQEAKAYNEQQVSKIKHDTMLCFYTKIRMFTRISLLITWYVF